MQNVPGCFLGTMCIALEKGEKEGTRTPASNSELISFLTKLSNGGVQHLVCNNLRLEVICKNAFVTGKHLVF